MRVIETEAPIIGSSFFCRVEADLKFKRQKRPGNKKHCAKKQCSKKNIATTNNAIKLQKEKITDVTIMEGLTLS